MEALVGCSYKIHHPNGEIFVIDIKGPLRNQQVVMVPGLGLNTEANLAVTLRISKQAMSITPEALDELKAVMLKHTLLSSDTS